MSSAFNEFKPEAPQLSKVKPAVRSPCCFIFRTHVPKQILYALTTPNRLHRRVCRHWFILLKRYGCLQQAISKPLSSLKVLLDYWAPLPGPLRQKAMLRILKQSWAGSLGSLYGLGWIRSSPTSQISGCRARLVKMRSTKDGVRYQQEEFEPRQQGAYYSNPSSSLLFCLYILARRKKRCFWWAWIGCTMIWAEPMKALSPETYWIVRHTRAMDLEH